MLNVLFARRRPAPAAPTARSPTDPSQGLAAGAASALSQGADPATVEALWGAQALARAQAALEAQAIQGCCGGDFPGSPPARI